MRSTIASARPSSQDGGAALSDDVRSKERPHGREQQRRLIREVQLLDCAQEAESLSAHGVLQPDAPAMSDLFGGEGFEQSPMEPLRDPR